MRHRRPILLKGALSCTAIALLFTVLSAGELEVVFDTITTGEYIAGDTVPVALFFESHVTNTTADTLPLLIYKKQTRHPNWIFSFCFNVGCLPPVDTIPDAFIEPKSTSGLLLDVFVPEKTSGLISTIEVTIVNQKKTSERFSKTFRVRPKITALTTSAVASIHGNRFRFMPMHGEGIVVYSTTEMYGPIRFSLMTPSGKTVFATTMVGQGTTQQLLPIPPLPSGVYIAQLGSQTGLQRQTIGLFH